MATTFVLLALVAFPLGPEPGALSVAQAGSSSTTSQSSGQHEQHPSATTTYGTRTPRPPVGSAAAQTNARSTEALKAAAAKGAKSGTQAIDESERRFSPQERRIAETLSAEGKNVKALKESKQQGLKNADALVDGELTEFKSLSAGAKAETVRNVVSKSLRGTGAQPNSGQARSIVIDARGSGLAADRARIGLDQVRELKDSPGRLDSVRIVGDGFDFTDTNFK